LNRLRHRFLGGGCKPAAQRKGRGVNTPARWGDEDAGKLALAPKDGPRYLQHSDGSWSFVGEDGWPVSPEEFFAESGEHEIGATGHLVIDVDPVAVTDIESEQL
jgi:hypothetical protein